MRNKNERIGRFTLIISAAALVLSLAGLQSWAEGPATGAQGKTQAPTSGTEAEAEAEAVGNEMPELTEEVLEDPEMIATGEGIWQEQCRHCHGRSAYPGKAPKLKPSRYTPDFVYHRVTEGFRGMPAWKDVYSEEERVAITAYVLSKQFSP